MVPLDFKRKATFGFSFRLKVKVLDISSKTQDFEIVKHYAETGNSTIESRL